MAADAPDPATQHQPPATRLITALTLTDFRSYAAATLSLETGVTVLHGVRRIEELMPQDDQSARDVETLTRKLRG